MVRRPKQQSEFPARYIDTAEGGRVYILPLVPIGIQIAAEPEFNVGKARDFLSEKIGDEERLKRALKIFDSYEGRQFDALNVMSYALKKNRFDDIAKRLEDEYEKNIAMIHPETRFARTDVTCFFLEMLVDLDVAPLEKVKDEIKLYKEIGKGVYCPPADK